MLIMFSSCFFNFSYAKPISYHTTQTKTSQTSHEEPQLEKINFRNLYKQSYQLIILPIKNQNMLWIVLPLMLSTIVMIFYFGLYKYEELGWNTAVGNGLVLVFVGLDLLRQMYQNNNIVEIVRTILHGSTSILSSQPKTILALIILLYGLFLVIVNFVHLFPKKLAFFISSALPINLVAYLTIVIVYTNLKLNLLLLISCFIVFIILYLLSKLIQFFIPTVIPTMWGEDTLKNQEQHNISNIRVAKIKKVWVGKNNVNDNITRNNNMLDQDETYSQNAQQETEKYE